MLRVACPKCAKSLGLPDTAAGKTVKCPKCAQLFKAPAAAKAKPVKTAASNSADEIAKRIQEELAEATPYELKQDALTVDDMKKSAQAEAVDAMVIDAARTKKRNKAWEMIGLPAKFMKRAALSACIFWISSYLFLLMVIVLANHNMEQAEKTGGFITSGGVKTLPRYLFVQDVFEFSPQQLAPLPFWGIITGGLVLALCIYGLQLAGAESMKKLENYRLAVIASVVGTLTLNLFCLWCLLALMDKGVQYEFRVSKRRAEGKVGDELYIEEGMEEEEEGEDDEDEDDEEEEEEEEEKRPVRRRK